LIGPALLHQRTSRHGDLACSCGWLHSKSIARGLYGGKDIFVASATAQVRGKRVKQIFVTDMAVLFKQARCQHQKSRRAETALKRMVLNKGLLQMIELPSASEPLDRADFAAFGLHRKHQAGTHRRSVEQHGAGTAYPMFATDVRSGLTAVIANGIH
jgi:hypothetical protein